MIGKEREWEGDCLSYQRLERKHGTSRRTLRRHCCLDCTNSRICIKTQHLNASPYQHRPPSKQSERTTPTMQSPTTTTAAFATSSNIFTSCPSTPVSRRVDSFEPPCIYHSAPQCCHCGYRGQHADQCPFNPNPRKWTIYPTWYVTHLHHDLDIQWPSYSHSISSYCIAFHISLHPKYTIIATPHSTPATAFLIFFFRNRSSLWYPHLTFDILYLTFLFPPNVSGSSSHFAYLFIFVILIQLETRTFGGGCTDKGGWYARKKSAHFHPQFLFVTHRESLYSSPIAICVQYQFASNSLAFLAVKTLGIRIPVANFMKGLGSHTTLVVSDIPLFFRAHVLYSLKNNNNSHTRQFRSILRHFCISLTRQSVSLFNERILCRNTFCI